MLQVAPFSHVGSPIPVLSSCLTYEARPASILHKRLFERITDTIARCWDECLHFKWLAGESDCAVDCALTIPALSGQQLVHRLQSYSWKMGSIE
jgi:hypothetical protein